LLEKMHEHCLLWSRRHEAAFASTKYELIHLTRNITKFDMQTTIKICDVVKQLFNHVRVLRMQIDNKLKWNAHLRSVQKKMITQTLTLSRLIAFTWRTCFSRVRLIYTTVIRSTIIYDSIIWHASHERSNSVVVTTKKLVKLQQQSLRLICDNFKTVSMQILEAETHVQLIQLHMIRLQMFFRQRMKKHRHDELIESFCRQIKHRLSETRERRRRKARKTSIERKIRWTQVMHAKLSADERENVVFSNRTLIKLFLRKWKNMWSAYQTKNRRRVCETLLKDITSKRMKLHKDLSKSKSFFAIHMRTKRIELADYLFFRRVLIVLTSDCLCGHSRQTLRHILLFCREWSEDRQRMLRDDETTDMSRLLNTAKDLKASIIWLMRINLLTQFSLTREYLD
jgi:tubulin alpha